MKEKKIGTVMYTAKDIGDIVERIFDVVNAGRDDYQARFGSDEVKRLYSKSITSSHLKQTQQAYIQEIPEEVRKELSQTFALRNNPEF